MNLNNVWIEIECPTCHFHIDIQIIDVKTESTINCHNCKDSIKLVDAEASTHRAEQEINNQLNDLLNIF